MKTKIIFPLFILILLSFSVFADVVPTGQSSTVSNEGATTEVKMSWWDWFNEQFNTGAVVGTAGTSSSGLSCSNSYSGDFNKFSTTYTPTDNINVGNKCSANAEVKIYKCSDSTCSSRSYQTSGYKVNGASPYFKGWETGVTYGYLCYTCSAPAQTTTPITTSCSYSKNTVDGGGSVSLQKGEHICSADGKGYYIAQSDCSFGGFTYCATGTTCIKYTVNPICQNNNCPNGATVTGLCKVNLGEVCSDSIQCPAKSWCQNKKCVASECVLNTDCPASTNPCETTVCKSPSCLSIPSNEGTYCGVGKTCQIGECLETTPQPSGASCCEYAESYNAKYSFLSDSECSNKLGTPVSSNYCSDEAGTAGEEGKEVSNETGCSSTQYSEKAVTTGIIRCYDKKAGLKYSQLSGYSLTPFSDIGIQGQSLLRISSSPVCNKNEMCVSNYCVLGYEDVKVKEIITDAYKQFSLFGIADTLRQFVGGDDIDSFASKAGLCIIKEENGVGTCPAFIQNDLPSLFGMEKTCGNGWIVAIIGLFLLLFIFSMMTK
jgi:hypothetical protein